MNRPDAMRIVAYISAGFPGRGLDDASVQLFVAEVSVMADHQVAFEAAQQLVREAERFPTIKEFRQTYHAVNRRKAAARSETHGLEQSSKREIPEWVHVWWWCRRGRDPRETRSFPQQRAANADEPFLSDGDYSRLLAEWMTAGSPRLGSAGELAGMVAAETRPGSPEEVRRLLVDEDPEPGTRREKRGPETTQASHELSGTGEREKGTSQRPSRSGV